MTDQPPKDQPQNKAPNKPKSRVPRIILFVVLTIVIVGGLWYWLATAGRVSTDDAYTDGRAITIAPKVAGYVIKLNVTDNQLVHAGDILAELNASDYIIARDKAAAALDLRKAQLQSAQIKLQIAQTTYPAQLSSAEAQREAATANLDKAKADYERQKKIDARATTQQQIDAATAAERTAASKVSENDAQLRIAKLAPQNIEAAKAEVAQLKAQVVQADADLAQAELNIGYTKIIAPQDGWVTKRNIELGNYVQISQSIMALVSPEIWITANFKESQLDKMRPGQSVKIEVDAYPHLNLRGKVDSIQMGSGSRFTAFPAENATGNYVKIVQRIPVKIVITEGLDPNIPLPLGLSVEPTVTLK